MNAEASVDVFDRKSDIVHIEIDTEGEEEEERRECHL